MKWDIDQLKFYSGITESKSSAPKKAEPEIVVLKEGARLIGTVTSDDGTCSAKVYRDSEWDQFYVKFEKDGRKMYDGEDSDGLSYADSREDGFGIAQQFINRVNSGDTEGLLESLTEGARIVGQFKSEDGNTVVKIYKDSEWDEYYVKFEHNGKQLFRNEESDGLSYTDSFEDGRDIAKEFIDRVDDGDTSFLDNELRESKFAKIKFEKNAAKVNEGHTVLPRSEESDPESLRYQGPIPGLEGPFRKKTKSGDYVTVYYDPKEGKYYNRTSDMYYSNEEATSLFEAETVSLLSDTKTTVDDQNKANDRMGVTQDETSVKIPAGLVAQIDKRIKEVEKSKDEFDKVKYMEQDSVKDKTIDCLKHFKELLTGCTVGKHKEANIYYAGLMSPIQHLLPANLVKFLHAADALYKPMDTSVYPQKPKSKDKPD